MFHRGGLISPNGNGGLNDTLALFETSLEALRYGNTNGSDGPAKCGSDCSTSLLHALWQGYRDRLRNIKMPDPGDPIPHKALAGLALTSDVILAEMQKAVLM